MTRKLGDVQKACLKLLLTHGGTWPSGWYYENSSRTARVLASLETRGAVARTADSRSYRYGRWALTIDGLALARKLVDGS